MGQVGNAATKGEKEIRTNWPVEEGLTAGTQKQTGREMALVPQETVVPERLKVGL